MLLFEFLLFGPQDFTKTPNDTFEVSRDGTKSTISYIDYVREAYRGSDVVAGDIDPRRPGPLSSPLVLSFSFQPRACAFCVSNRAHDTRAALVIPPPSV